jgi:magnesium transporter
MATEVFGFLELDKQTDLSTLVNEEELLVLIEQLNFDDKIDLIEEVPANVVKKILKNTSVTERKLINQFLNYPEDSAGSLMTIEFVDLKKDMTLFEAMNRVRMIGRGKETIYTCYVTDRTRTLDGIISLKELVLGDPESKVQEIMETNVISVNTHADQEHIVNEFKKYDFLSMPVVDNEGRLVGIITIDDVVDVMEEEATEDFQKMAAIIPTDEEYLDASPFSLARRRIFWLVILMFSAVITEFITNENKSLTSQFVILIALMPMLMSTGGNAGAQASTLVIRGITLGEIKFKDFFKVVFKEMRVGIMMGISLGVLNFARLYFMGRPTGISIVIGLTLIGTTTIAALLGGTLPIIAKKMKMDPAVMANPLITTITDATTLLIYFFIAAMILI